VRKDSVSLTYAITVQINVFVLLLNCFYAMHKILESSWNVMAHGDAREGKWRGNWRMEWVASTLTLPWNVVYPALLPLMRTPLLPAVDWTHAPADLNGFVRFAERRNLVSARVPSRFKRTIPFTLPQNMVYTTFLPLMRKPRLPVVDRTDAPADLNGLVRFSERRNLVSAHLPSHFKRSLIMCKKIPN